VAPEGGCRDGRQGLRRQDQADPIGRDPPGLEQRGEERVSAEVVDERATNDGPFDAR